MKYYMIVHSSSGNLYRQNLVALHYYIEARIFSYWKGKGGQGSWGLQQDIIFLSKSGK